MTVAVVSRDLLMATRIADAAARAGVNLRRVDAPAELPPVAEVGLVLVDWDAREPDWGEQLNTWRGGGQEPASPRIVLYGPHTDLAAHAAAKDAGLGPMWARSKLVAEIQTLLG